jgi:hypothetical protein
LSSDSIAAPEYSQHVVAHDHPRVGPVSEHLAMARRASADRDEVFDQRAVVEGGGVSRKL